MGSRHPSPAPGDATGGRLLPHQGQAPKSRGGCRGVAGGTGSGWGWGRGDRKIEAGIAACL